MLHWGFPRRGEAGRVFRLEKADLSSVRTVATRSAGGQARAKVDDRLVLPFRQAEQNQSEGCSREGNVGCVQRNP